MMSDRPTPETDNQIFEAWDDEGHYIAWVVDADFARRLERQRDELLEAIYAIDERFIDGCDTYDDWKFMGQTARDIIAAVKGGNQ
jgi:hypothetical protein